MGKYVSKAQQKFMHAVHPKIAKRWDKETEKAGGFKKLPARKKAKAKSKGKKK